MTLIRDILRQYWTHMLAIVVFICAAVRYWRLGDFFGEDHASAISLVVVGLILVLYGDEWTASPLDDSERLTRDHDWLQRRSYTYRSWAGPVLGGIALIWGAIWLYRS
jgi:hypothetical protein